MLIQIKPLDLNQAYLNDEFWWRVSSIMDESRTNWEDNFPHWSQFELDESIWEDFASWVDDWFEGNTLKVLVL